MNIIANIVNTTYTYVHYLLYVYVFYKLETNQFIIVYLAVLAFF